MSKYDEIIIVIVDDNEVDTLFLERTLRKNKVSNEIKVFATAEEAFEEIKNNRQHYLLLIDVNLPGISGIDLIKELDNLKRSREIVYIVTSSAKDVIEYFHVDLQGAVAFLPKPINQHRLMAIIEGVEIIFKRWEVQAV